MIGPKWAMLMLMTSALAGMPQTGRAGEPAPLDDAFLEYLAEFEDLSDNWTWFADDEETPTQTTPPAPIIAKPPARTPANGSDKDIKR